MTDSDGERGFPEPPRNGEDDEFWEAMFQSVPIGARAIDNDDDDDDEDDPDYRDEPNEDEEEDDEDAFFGMSWRDDPNPYPNPDI